MLTEKMDLKNIDEVKNILGNGLTQEKFDAIRVGWKRAKKKFQVQGKKGTKLYDFIKSEKRV